MKNSFVFVDWDRSEAARRRLGCFGGLTSDANNIYPTAPSAATVASIVQDAERRTSEPKHQEPPCITHPS